MRPYHGKYLELKKVRQFVDLDVESVFCILTQRVRVIFAMPIAVRVDLEDLIVKVSCCHHNFFMHDFTLTYRRRRRRLKGIHSRPDTNRTGAEGLSFYYPRLLHCLDQMLALMSLSQHRVSSSKTVRSRAPCGSRCIGHAVSTWSAVCSEAPHSQFGEGARPHLYMDKWNRPTPVRRRLNLTQAARGKPIPTGLAPVSATKARRLEAFS